MRPTRADIAAPPLPPGLVWVGGDAPRLDRALARGPMLVHFFDLAQLNCARALPYVAAWSERYRGHGLSVIGVHTPRSPFTRSAAAVEGALERLGIDWPVAVDAEFAMWRAYGCEGWPSLFLWGRGGALRWYHLGEGEYRATEEAIREALGDPPNGDWPEPLDPIRPADAPGAKVVPPTAELTPGGSLEEPWRPGDDPVLEIEYAAASAAGGVDGAGELSVSVDGGEPATVAVDGPGLAMLADDPFHRERSLRIEATGEVAIHSVQFAAGPAPA